MASKTVSLRGGYKLRISAGIYEVQGSNIEYWFEAYILKGTYAKWCLDGTAKATITCGGDTVAHASVPYDFRSASSKTAIGTSYKTYPASQGAKTFKLSYRDTGCNLLGDGDVSITVSTPAPDTPTNPRVIKVTNSDYCTGGSVKVGWTNAGERTEVQRSHGDGWEIQTNSATGTSWTDSNLGTSRQYSYRMANFKNGRWSAFSTHCTANRTMPITSFNITLDSSYNAHLSWDRCHGPYSGVKKYIIRRYEAGRSWDTKTITTITDQTTSYEDRTTQKDKKYTYYIDVHNIGGWSESSRVTVYTPPSDVYSLSARWYGSSQAKLTATGLPTYATSYKIYDDGHYVKTVSSFPAYVSASRTESHRYEVVAYVPGGESSGSTYADRIYPVSVPVAPTELSPQSITYWEAESNFTHTWNHDAGQSHNQEAYEFYWNKDGEAQPTVTVTTSNEFHNAKYSPGYYDFHVKTKSRNQPDWSPWSAKSAILHVLTKPSVTNLSPTGIINTTDLTISFDYQQSESHAQTAFSYEIEVNGQHAKSGTIESATTQFKPNLPNLGEGDVVTYTITPASHTVWGNAQTEEVTIQGLVPPSKPNPPTIQTPGVGVTDTDTTIQWTHNPTDGRAQAHAEIEVTPPTGSAQTYTATTSTSKPVETDAAGTYSVRVRTKAELPSYEPGPAEWSEWSTPVEFNVIVRPVVDIKSPKGTWKKWNINIGWQLQSVNTETLRQQDAQVRIKTPSGSVLYSKDNLGAQTSIIPNFHGNHNQNLVTHVRVKAGGVWSHWDEQPFKTSYDRPVVEGHSAEWNSVLGGFDIVINMLGPDKTDISPVTSYRLERVIGGGTEWTVIRNEPYNTSSVIELSDIITKTGVSVQYKLVVTADNGRTTDYSFSKVSGLTYSGDICSWSLRVYKGLDDTDGTLYPFKIPEDAEKFAGMTIIEVEDWTAEGGTFRVDDRDRPRADGRLFGQDFITPGDIVMNLIIRGKGKSREHKFRDAMARREMFATFWTLPDTRNHYSKICELEVAGRYLVEGRPRDIEWDDTLSQFGIIRARVSFARLNNICYAVPTDESAGTYTYNFSEVGRFNFPTSSSTNPVYPQILIQGPFASKDQGGKLTFKNGAVIYLAKKLELNQTLVIDTRPGHYETYMNSKAVGMIHYKSSPFSDFQLEPEGDQFVIVDNPEFVSGANLGIRYRDVRKGL